MLKEILERVNATPTELTQVIEDGKKPSDFWSENLLYEGDNLYELYIKFQDDIADYIDLGKNWEETYTEYDGDDDEEYEEHEYFELVGQESYLGYSPKNKMFISGWDCWYSGDMGTYDSNSQMCYFFIKNGKFSPIMKPKFDQEIDGETMYGRRYGGYSYLQSKIKDLVDIRLD